MAFQLHHLIHFLVALLALATLAAPLQDLASHNTIEISPRVGTKSLLSDLAQFDMQKTFSLADPRSNGTRVVPPKAMGAVPETLRFVVGTFDPDKILQAAEDRLTVDASTYDKIATVLKATTYTSDLVKSAISATRRATQHILDAVGQGDWSARGKGSAPIKDWRYMVNGDKLVVLELKTSQALTSGDVTQLTRLVTKKQLKMVKIREDHMLVNSLVETGGAKLPTRLGRTKSVLALMQLLAEMYDGKSFMGVLTNGHDWVVCQRVITPRRTSSRIPTRTKDATETIAVTRLSGVRPDGRSHALNILLAMSLSAEQQAEAQVQ